MRMIDADALIAKAYIMQEPNGFIHSVVTERQIVKAPTIDPESLRPRGWWEHIADDGRGNCFGYCSNCHTGHKAQNRTVLIGSYRYCKWCGVKLIGEKE